MAFDVPSLIESLDILRLVVQCKVIACFELYSITFSILHSTSVDREGMRKTRDAAVHNITQLIINYCVVVTLTRALYCR